MTQENDAFSDETLTAYLDGELDAQAAQAIDAALATDETLANRLSQLNVPMDVMRRVMAPEVLGAPAMPASLFGITAPQPVNTAPTRSRYVAPLALAASFVVGMIVTSLLQPASTLDDAVLDWTAAVASYQALYVTETLSGATQEQDVTDAVLSRAAEEFDVALAPATQVDGITFKRAQMLGFQGKPLLQMAYLTDDGTPMALCLVRVDEPDRGTQNAVIFDLAGISWVKNGVGYFLIGGDDADQIEDLSSRVIASL